MRSRRAMWSLCRSTLSGLDLDLPLDVDQLCERHGQRRGRPIRVVAHPLPAGVPNGIWLAAEDADYFFHQANTTRWHRDQIVIHEFAHLIAGHQMLSDLPTVMAGLSAADTEATLRRTCYDDVREAEAETIASMILTWAAEANDGVGRSASDTDVRGLQRLLGGHKGWL
ncbi:hypothetical protein ABLE92_23220 [Gordonia sp. VNQ95]|uniref:hypothetical protein n=1 Tax=Gordonia TaxID=2053 RepID=UPI0032B34992